MSTVDQFSLGGPKFSEPSGTGEELPVSTYADNPVRVAGAPAEREVGRADFTRLLLLAVRCQKQAEGEAETSCYADRDPELLADLALSIAARMLGLQLPDEEEGSP